MARKFVFRYDTLLRIRKQREDEQKRVVAERLREIAQVRERLNTLHHQIDEETRAIRTGQEVGTIDIQQVMRHRHWLGHLHRGLLDAVGRERFLEARLSQERSELTERMKQRRILEKLKERRLLHYQAEVDRRETRENDEMATIRFVHDRRVEPAST